MMNNQDLDGNESKDKTYEQNQDQQICQNLQGQSDQQEEQSSSEQQSSQELRQKPAFQLIQQSKLFSTVKTTTIDCANQAQHSQQKLQNKTINDQTNQAQLNNDQEQQIDQDQRNAFLYLFHVRKQKKTLIKQKKQRKHMMKNYLKGEQQKLKIQQKNNLSNSYQVKNNEDKKQQEQQDKICMLHVKSQLQTQKLTKFKEQLTSTILSNFNIVIKNAQYLIKTNQSFKNNNKRFNTKLYESIKLQKTPEIYQLMRLTLGEVQDAMRKICNQIIYGTKSKKNNKNLGKDEQKNSENLIKQGQINSQKIENDLQKEMNQQKQQPNQDIPQSNNSRLYNFSLWIYSLLCIHQGWSSYIHFQSLGQINAVLMKQTQIHKLKNLTQQQMNQLSIIFVIMTNVFKQKHLQKNMQNLFLKIYDIYSKKV